MVGRSTAATVTGTHGRVGYPARWMRRPVTVALFLALLATVFVLPPTAAASTTSLRSSCGTGLRTGPRVTAAIKVRLNADTAVKADKVVVGGPWRVTCGGEVLTGVRWYRIYSVNGRSVSRIYGVPYVYGMKWLFKTMGTWFGRPNPWAGHAVRVVPATRPSGQMWISGDQHGRTISRLTFRNRPKGQNVIVLYNVSNLKIDLIDFDTVPEGIYIWNSHDVEIGRIRARNIFGPYTRTTFHSGNLIQADQLETAAHPRHQGRPAGRACRRATARGAPRTSSASAAPPAPGAATAGAGRSSSNGSRSTAGRGSPTRGAGSSSATAPAASTCGSATASS